MNFEKYLNFLHHPSNPTKRCVFQTDSIYLHPAQQKILDFNLKIFKEKINLKSRERIDIISTDPRKFINCTIKIKHSTIRLITNPKNLDRFVPLIDKKIFNEIGIVAETEENIAIEKLGLPTTLFLNHIVKEKKIENKNIFRVILFEVPQTNYVNKKYNLLLWGFCPCNIYNILPSQTMSFSSIFFHPDGWLNENLSKFDLNLLLKNEKCFSCSKFDSCKYVIAGKNNSNPIDNMNFRIHSRYSHKENKKVGIVIPVYNYGNFLINAVNSCLNQKYKNIQIMIVNDGSTDETEKIGNYLSKKYFPKVLFFSQKNKGVGTARNIGINNLIDCEYYSCLDADDQFFENYIRLMVGSIENYKNISLAYSGIYNIYKKTIDPFETISDRRLIFHDVIPYFTLFKKEVFIETKGFGEERLSFEDWEFWIKARINKFNFFHLPVSLLKYNDNTNISRIDILTEKRLYLENKLKIKFPIYFNKHSKKIKIKTNNEKFNIIINKKYEIVVDDYDYFLYICENYFEDNSEILITPYFIDIFIDVLKKSKYYNFISPLIYSKSELKKFSWKTKKREKILRKYWRERRNNFSVYSPNKSPTIYLSKKGEWNKNEKIIVANGIIFSNPN